MSFFDKISRLLSPHREERDEGPVAGKMMAPPPFALNASCSSGSVPPKTAAKPSTGFLPKTLAAAPAAAASVGKMMTAPPFSLMAGAANLLPKAVKGIEKVPGTNISGQNELGGYSSKVSMGGLKWGPGLRVNGPQASLDRDLWKDEEGKTRYGVQGSVSRWSMDAAGPFGTRLNANGPHGSFNAGSWGNNGATRYGVRANASLGDAKLGNTVGGIAGLGISGPSAGVEASFGDDGFTLGVGAGTGMAKGWLGNFDKESSTDQQIGASYALGPGWRAGLRGHRGDSDGDGRREYGFGVDIPFTPFGFDIKTEDPVRTFAPALAAIIPGAGPALSAALLAKMSRDPKTNQTDLLINSVKALLGNRHKEKAK